MIRLITFTLSSILICSTFEKSFAKDSSLRDFLKDYDFQYTQSSDVSNYERLIDPYLKLFTSITKNLIKGKTSTLSKEMSDIEMVEVSH